MFLMGLTSLIWSLLPAAEPADDLSASSFHPQVQPPSMNRSYPNLCGYFVAPGAPKHVTFTLSTKLYSWLEAMAMQHNYGSVHKSIRDLLKWACTGCDEDMRWLFSTCHEIPECLKNLTQVDFVITEASTIATKTKSRYMRASPHDPVTLNARISDTLHDWIVRSVSQYRLSGPSDVLEAICRCAIALHAADDIFASDVSGQYLPTSTAELYHDLGLIRHSTTLNSPRL